MIICLFIFDKKINNNNNNNNIFFEKRKQKSQTKKKMNSSFFEEILVGDPEPNFWDDFQPIQTNPSECNYEPALILHGGRSSFRFPFPNIAQTRENSTDPYMDEDMDVFGKPPVIVKLVGMNDVICQSSSVATIEFYGGRSYSRRYYHVLSNHTNEETRATHHKVNYDAYDIPIALSLTLMLIMIIFL
jgi:hypothetical protein